ncbi:MAG: acyltransferase [Vicinamibacteria bacterium]|nr:acyltransferase [Vicinamibacteria bacterium]
MADMPALTSLRAIAALLVVLYHFSPHGQGRLVEIVCGQGHVGVTVFFVLSGFLITARYYPEIERGEHRLGEYFVRRAARILPLYFFVLTLSHLMTRGTPPLGAVPLAEWTLTHALFGSSLEDLTVLTSWSLTLEECFYASAPLVFLALARLSRGLGPVRGPAIGLTGVAAGLGLVGAVILQFSVPLAAADLNFLADPLLLRSFTIFGRYFDFALGTAAGLLFLSGKVEAVWRAPRGGLYSTVLALAGAGLLFTAQALMVLQLADPNAQWRWNMLAAVGSAAIVLALTCAHAPLSRLLSAAGLVYLGRTSYALYLIQTGPLGHELVFWLLPGGDGVHLIVLYLGLTAISALLFELVEEPARETVLALWRRKPLLEAFPRARLRALSVVILLGALATQHALWAAHTVDAPTEAEVERVLGPGSRSVLRMEIARTTEGGKEPRVPIPPDWLEGRPGKQHGPTSLLVFADERPVPFLGTGEPADSPPSAWYRWPRVPFLSLDVDLPARVTVVDRDLPTALALAGSHFAEAPLRAAAPLPLLGLIGLLWWRRGGAIWAPRTSLAAAAGLVFLWLVTAAYQQPWAPLLLPLEVLAITWLAVPSRGRTRGAAATAAAPIALPEAE